MKKLSTLLFLLLITSNVCLSQTKPLKLQTSNLTTKLYRERFKDIHHSNNIHQGNNSKKNTVQKNNFSNIIGATYYDYQTNASMPRRIFAYDDGRLTASWNGSMQQSGYSDRGTFVNTFDRFNWATNPTSRIEADSVGWSSLIVSNNKEILIAEPNIMSANNGFQQTWNTQKVFTQNSNLYAPHSAISGDKIHIIMSGIIPDSITGFLAPIYYTRSLDGGISFDSIRADFAISAGYDSSNHAGDLGPNAYSIDASGNTVAILALGVTEDVVLLKSIDNGTTWTKTIIREFPIKKYKGGKTDANGDGIMDTVLGVTGDGSILIDHAGVVHIVFSDLDMFADDTGEMNIFITSKSDHFCYWNDKDKSIKEIPSLLDINLDGIFNSGSKFLGEGNIRYGNAGYSFNPQLSEASYFGSHHICLGYVGVTETDTNDLGVDFRSLYGLVIDSIYSTGPYNSSQTWSSENVYLSIDKRVTSIDLGLTLYIATDGIWQQDFDPGNHVQGMHETSMSDIVGGLVYFTFSSSVETTKNSSIRVRVYPNPSASDIHLKIYSKKEFEVVLKISNTLGQNLLSDRINLNASENSITINSNKFPSGMYTITLISEEGILSEKVLLK